MSSFVGSFGHAARLAVLMCLVGCGWLLTGCQPAENGGSAADGGGSQRKFITVGTAPAGGAFAPVGNAIANVVEANKGDLNWVVSPQGTKGTQENIRKLDAGEMEFGMANAAISFFATRGEGDWEKPFEIRTVATLAPNVGIFVTTAGSGIKTMADLKGKRVVTGPAGAGFDYFLEPLLAAHGLAMDDIEALPGNYFTAADMLADGKADAAFMGGATPIPALTQLCSSQDVVFIKFDPAAPEKLKDYPFYFPLPIKAGSYSDLDEDLMGINVGNMHLITHQNVSEEVVYEFTKRMYENRAQIAEKHPAAKALNETNAVRDTGTPFHPGAIKFYREAGIWPAEAP